MAPTLNRGRSDLKSAGLEVMTKVYPSNVIPDRKEQANIHHQIKKNYRPNNFLNEQHHLNIQGPISGFKFNSNETDEEQLEIELTGKLLRFIHFFRG